MIAARQGVQMSGIIGGASGNN